MSIIKEKGGSVLIKSLRRMSTLIAAPLVALLLGLTVTVALVPAPAQAADIPANATGASSAASSEACSRRIRLVPDPQP
jgi:hypothetical protein